MCCCESGEVCRHGSAVVGDQNAIFTGSDGENLRVGPADDVTLRCGLKVAGGADIGLHVCAPVVAV